MVVTVRAGRSGAVTACSSRRAVRGAMTQRSYGRWYLRHGPVDGIGHARCIGRLTERACPSVRAPAARQRPRGGVGSGRGPGPAGLPAGRPARHRRRHHDARAARDRRSRRGLAAGGPRTRRVPDGRRARASARSCCCCRRSAACSTSSRRSGRRPCCRRSRPPTRGCWRWSGTSLFAGFGLARRLDGGTALRPRRLRVGIAVGDRADARSPARLFAGAAIANEHRVARPDAAARGSRFGPTDAEAELAALRRRPRRRQERPAHRPPPRPDRSAGPIGSVDLSGQRVGTNFRWLAYVATDRELGQYGAAELRGAGLDSDARRRLGRRRCPERPRSRRSTCRRSGRPCPPARARPPRTAASRSIEGARGSPLSRRRRRRDVPGSVPADPLAGRRRRPSSAGAASSTTGSSSTASSGRSRAASTARPARIRPEAIQATIEVFLTATERGDELVDLSSGPMTLDDEPERFGKRDRLARMLRVVDRPARPSGRDPPAGDRPSRRRRDPDRLPRPAGARGGGRGRRLVGGRPVGRRRRGVPAAAQADPRRGDGGRPVGPADGPLRRQVRPGSRRRVREARGRCCPRPLAEHVERTLDVLAAASRATRHSASTSTG